jgi:putative ABC transport system substrate-binding protein
MKRRTFITGLGSAAAWPVAVLAQQRVMPVVGFLFPGTETTDSVLFAGFRQGLDEGGYVEGRNVEFLIRHADNQSDRILELAFDLVRRRAAVIVAIGGAAAAAKAATTTIPIVFANGGDPVALGLVTSLNRPGGNMTGASRLNEAYFAKGFE